VREFGMTAAMTGIALHGGLIPYGGTFLTFSDYARNACAWRADASARDPGLQPRLDRPGRGRSDAPADRASQQPAADSEPDAVAAGGCGRDGGRLVRGDRTRQRSDLLVLTRQGLPQLARDAAALEGIRRGGYVLADCQGAPQCIVIATGSEVSIALEAVQRAQAAGKRVRLVSMPCTQLFDAQDAAYRESVLPAAVTRARGGRGRHHRAVVALCRHRRARHRHRSLWRLGQGSGGDEKFGFTADNVERAINESIGGEHK
jgi:transketolase